MGLLLSILVSCVGVVELIAFYSHLRRSLIVANSNDNDFESITCTYRKMLIKEYKHILAEMNGRDLQPKIRTNFALSTSPKAIFNNEQNYKENVLNTDSNNIRENFSLQVNKQVVEKDYTLNSEMTNINPISTQVNTTKSVQEMNHFSNINYFESVPTKSSISNFQDTRSRTESDFKPLSTQINESSSSQEVNISSHETDMLKTNVLDTCYIFESNEAPKAPSNIEKLYLQEDSVAQFFHDRRSSSPFPTYETLAPRSSACSELLENSIISIVEIEENENYVDSEDVQVYLDTNTLETTLIHSSHSSRSPSPREWEYCRGSSSPIRLSNQEERIRRYRSVSPCKRLTEEDSLHLQKRRRSKSSSDLPEILKRTSNYQLVSKDYWQKSPSPFEPLLYEDNEEDVSQKYVLVQNMFNEDFKNSLDGVKTKSPNEERKREFKRKRSNRNRTSQISSNTDSNSGNKESLQNLTLKQPLLEFGISVKEEVSLSPVSSNFLTSQDVVCEKSLLGTESNSTQKDLETTQNREDRANTSQAHLIKHQKKSDAFWVN